MRARHAINRRPRLLIRPIANAVPLVAVDELGRIRKEHRTCCAAHVDEYGRWPVGYCGPSCQGRLIVGPMTFRP